jgi:DNA-binding Lrp family transcriptional regulator
MKKKMIDLLLELLRDSKRSDREIAKILGVSQPTVTRMRNKLVKDGMIQGWTIIPNFVKMGFEILAITCVKVKESKMLELEKTATEYFQKKPNVVMAAGGAQGMGMNGVMVSIHKSYSDFSNFLTNHMIYWGDNIDDHCSILISLGQRVVKPFSLKYLAQLKEEKTTP